MTDAGPALSDSLTANEDAVEGSPRRRAVPWWVWRIGGGILTLVAVSILIFFATQVLPGDAAKSILGRDATPEKLEALRAQLGLNRPALEQYLDWARNLLTGDFGLSLVNGRPVEELFLPRAVNTLALALCAIAIALPLSILLGSLSASRRDGALDQGIAVTSLTFNALPEFVIGLGLVVIFSTGLMRILPAVSIFPPEESAFSNPTALVLPALALVLAISPYLIRLVRASLIDALDSEYVLTARLRGVRERRIIVNHALRNSMVPVVQGTAVLLAYLAGGIVVIEYVFRFPGLGGLLLEAVSARDLPLIQVTALFLAAVYVVVNLVADLLVVRLTPRLRGVGV